MQDKTLKQRLNDFLWHLDGRALRVGAGFAPMGGGSTYQERLEQELPCLLRCYEEGLRIFDTAEGYGHSEQVVGEFVRRIPRESIFLSTKSGFPFKARPKEAVQVFKDNFFRSFERLHTDHIDFFLIHDTEHYEVCLAEIVPFLHEQRQAGRIGYVGIGMRSLNAHELAIRSGLVDGVLSYLNYSLVKGSAARVAALARERGVAFINASVLHFGMIKRGDLLPPEKPVFGYDLRIRERINAMRALCDHMGVDIVDASFQHPLMNPDIDLTLCGVARMSNLDSTMKALRARILPEQWAEIYRLQREDPYFAVQDDLPSWA